MAAASASFSFSTNLPTYTDKFGECMTEIYKNFGLDESYLHVEPSLEHYRFYLTRYNESKKQTAPIISEFQEKMKALLPADAWLIHIIYEPSHRETRRSFLLIDNKLNYYNIGYELKSMDVPGYTGCKMTVAQAPLHCEKGICCKNAVKIHPLSGETTITDCPIIHIQPHSSDTLITSVKNIAQTMDIQMWSHYNRDGVRGYLPTYFITGTILESYRAHARTEYLLYQHAKALEEAHTTNKMLEARLSVLEAFLAPRPPVTPPPTVDLLDVSSPASIPTLNVVELANPPMPNVVEQGPT